MAARSRAAHTAASSALPAAMRTSSSPLAPTMARACGRPAALAGSSCTLVSCSGMTRSGSPPRSPDESARRRGQREGGGLWRVRAMGRKRAIAICANCGPIGIRHAGARDAARANQRGLC
eukprot:4249435-Prymnesium_polylepis.3